MNGSEIPSDKLSLELHMLPERDDLEAQPRLEQLTHYFLDLAGNTGALQPETVAYVREGGSLPLCLHEITKLAQPEQEEVALTAAREEYVNALMHRSHIPGRASNEDIPRLRSTYVNRVVESITQVIDAHGPEAALHLRQMPTLIEGASFNKAVPFSIEDFAANHLYILIDTALQEHVKRRSYIEQESHRNTVARVVGNRAIRLAVSGGVLVATLTPELHVVPIHDKALADDVEIGLTILSASVFGVDAPEEIRWRYLDVVHGRRTRQLHNQLASRKDLSDLALRMIYSATRYGSGNQATVATDHAGTNSKVENLRRFQCLNEELKYSNNEHGGKPYSGDEALGYAARLLIERADQLRDIMATEHLETVPRDKYMQLAREIINEDVTRMEKGLTISRFRRRLIRVAGLIPAMLFPSIVASTGDATSLGHDIVNSWSSKRHNPDEE